MKILEELPKNILPLEKHVHFEDSSSSALTKIMESLDKLNMRMEQIEEKVNQLVPPKMADPVGFLKNLISSVEEPTVTMPAFGGTCLLYTSPSPRDS